MSWFALVGANPQIPMPAYPTNAYLNKIHEQRYKAIGATQDANAAATTALQTHKGHDAALKLVNAAIALWEDVGGLCNKVIDASGSQGTAQQTAWMAEAKAQAPGIKDEARGAVGQLIAIQAQVKTDFANTASSVLTHYPVGGGSKGTVDSAGGESSISKEVTIGVAIAVASAVVLAFFKLG